MPRTALNPLRRPRPGPGASSAARAATSVNRRTACPKRSWGEHTWYDKVGNRTAVREADGSRVTWSYDATYQLTGEHRTGSSPYRDTYTYDPTGNRTLKIHDGARTTSAYDAANQLTYSQDASGRTTRHCRFVRRLDPSGQNTPQSRRQRSEQTARGGTFDADGNQQVVKAPNGDRTTYAWDYENRMTSVRLPSGIRNTMAYEPEGLRVKLEESTGTKKFVWDEQNYLAETDSANDTQVVYTNEPRLYGNLVSQRRLSGGVWTPHWYHFDAIGSTRELTTAGQVVSDAMLYDGWGTITVHTGSTAIPFTFGGRYGYYFETAPPLYSIRLRTYNATIGRWLSKDLIARLGTGPLTYDYVRNSPVALSDPMGAEAPPLNWLFDQLTPDEIEALLRDAQRLCGFYQQREAQETGGEAPNDDLFTIYREKIACEAAVKWQLENNPCIRPMYDALARLCPHFEINCGCCTKSQGGHFFWGKPPHLKICTADQWNAGLASTLFHELVHAAQWCSTRVISEFCNPHLLRAPNERVRV